MESGEDLRLLKVLGTYAKILGGVSRTVTYLMFLTSSVLTGLTGILASIFLPLWEIPVVTVLVWVVSFAVAFYASSVFWRAARISELDSSHNQEGSSIDEEKRTNRLIGLSWIVIFAVVGPLSYFLPFPQDIPVSISAGVGLGLLGMFVIMRARAGGASLNDLLAGVCLLATSPIYLFVTSASVPVLVVDFVLLEFVISAVYFAVAVSFSVGTRKRSADVLHAAREQA